MRRCLLFLMSLFALTLVSGCESAFAGPAVVKRWISDGGVGLELTKRGSRFSGKLYWLTRDGERFADLLCHGLHDREKNTMLFPLALRRGKSIKKLREGTSQYVEVQLNFDSDYLVGKWRTGSEPPERERTFYPYDG